MNSNIRNVGRGRNWFCVKVAAVLAAWLGTLAAGHGAETDYSQAVIADNPLVYYRFEEVTDSADAVDSSGRGNNGTYNSVTLQVPSFNASLGNAAEFDGELSSVTVPALGSAEAVSIEAWIMPSIFSTWRVIYNTDGYPEGAIHFQLIDDEKVEFAMSGNAPEDVNFGDDSVLGEGDWTHVVVTYNSSTATMAVYFNGSPFNTNVYTTAVAPGLQEAHIGAWNGADRQFEGLIDEVAIYPVVLTPEQVQAHYRAAVGTFVSVASHPQDAAVFAGASATFEATATVVGSTEPPQFQWQRNGEDIAGATNAAYTTPPLTPGDDGTRYRAVISVPGSESVAVTREALVSVTDLPADGYANAVAEDAPILYYRFNEAAGAASAADSSGADHAGTYTNVRLENASFNAVLGGAAGFDGSSGRVAVPALGSASQFTIEAWIKPEIYKTSQAVYTSDETAPGTVSVELVDEGGMLLSIEANDPTDFDFGDDILFPAGEWRYVVLTYDASSATARAYVDAELVDEATVATANPAEFGAAHLGAGSDVNSFYRGLIDEFAVYTNVLSFERILAHYARVSGPIISPQPQDAAVFSGSSVSFTAGLITGSSEPPGFQWQRNGVDISGATNATYTTGPLTDADNGSRYRAVITSGDRSVTTREAMVSVTSLPPMGYRDAVMADGPVVYYRFEDPPGSENATDSSASSNHGQYDDVALGQASFSAVLGSAARFDQSSLTLPSLATPAAFTVETWIRPDVFEEFNALFTTDEWIPGAVHLQLIDDEMVALSLNAGSDPDGEDLEEDAEFGGDGVFAEEEWRHLAVTYNSADSTANFYVNGTAVGTNVFSIPAILPDFTASHVGAWNGDERFYFGWIDEFALYDKVLPPDRVLAHYQAAAGASAPRPTLVVSRTGNELTFTWTGDFVLQQTDQLVTNSWTPVPGASANSATVTIGSGNAFYRLRSPN